MQKLKGVMEGLRTFMAPSLLHKWENGRFSLLLIVQCGTLPRKSSKVPNYMELKGLRTLRTDKINSTLFHAPSK